MEVSGMPTVKVQRLRLQAFRLVTVYTFYRPDQGSR